jgi:hypothetical protein
MRSDWFPLLFEVYEKEMLVSVSGEKGGQEKRDAPRR